MNDDVVEERPPGHSHEPVLNGLLNKIRQRPNGKPFRTCSDPDTYARSIHDCCVELWRRGLVTGRQVRPGQWNWEAKAT